MMHIDDIYMILLWIVLFTRIQLNQQQQIQNLNFQKWHAWLLL